MKTLKTLMTVFVLGSVLTSGIAQAGYSLSKYTTKTVSTNSKKFEFNASKIPNGAQDLLRPATKKPKPSNVFFQVLRKNSVNQQLTEHTRVHGLKANENPNKVKQNHVATSGAIRIATKDEHILGGVKVYASYSPQMFDNRICPRTVPLTLLVTPIESIWRANMEMVDRVGGCRYSALIPGEQLQDIYEFHERGVMISIGRLNHDTETSFETQLSVSDLDPHEVHKVEDHIEDFDDIINAHLGQLDQDTLNWVADDLAPGFRVLVSAGQGYYTY